MAPRWNISQVEDSEFHRVFDEVLKRPVCVRFHSGRVPVRDYEQAARLADHPNILAIYEVRQQDLITEAVAGTRLSDFLKVPGDRRAFTRRPAARMEPGVPGDPLS